MNPEEPGDGRRVERAIPSHLVWVEDLPYWATAAVLHLVALLILTMLSVEENRESESRKGRGEGVGISLDPPHAPPKRKDEPRHDPDTRPRHLDVRPVMTLPEEERAADLEVPQTSPDSLVKNYDPALFLPAVGVGRSDPGVYGERQGKASLTRSGGGGATEGGVQAALEWLRRHQADDGSWDARGFVGECRETCRNRDPDRYGDGLGVGNYEAGVTGLALLAFLGNGYTHRRGARPEFVACVAKGANFLKRVQVRSSDPTVRGRYSTNDGSKWTYEHAIATMAMAELLAISRDAPALEQSVRSAVELCLRAQNDDRGWGTRGWRYGYKPGDNDVSVVGWMVLALKTATQAGLDDLADDIEVSLKGALDYIERATDRTTGRTSYRHSLWADNRAGNLGRDVFSEELSCMTSVGVLCRLLTGAARSHSMVRKGVGILMAQPPRWQEPEGSKRSTINFYYWYYGSYALFQYGGAEWDGWNAHMKEALLSSQRQGDGCEAGSWDPVGEWGYRGGRVYATALNAMTLEVYYRYRSVESGATR